MTTATKAPVVKNYDVVVQNNKEEEFEIFLGSAFLLFLATDESILS